MEDHNLQEPDRENLLHDVSRILADLIKTVKVISVYPEDNPLPAKLRETFIERFADIIDSTGGLKFTIAKGEILYSGETVYIDRPPDDMLAAIFHDSGITEISFSPEFGFDEAGLFFKAMKSFVNKEEGAEDLVATLWQTNISGFDYSTLEDIILGEYDGDLTGRETMADDSSEIKLGSDSGGLQYSAIFLDDDEDKSEEQGVLVESGGVETATIAHKGEAVPLASAHELAETQMGFKPAPDQKRVSLPDTALILNDAFSMGESEQEQAAGIIEEDNELDMFGSAVDLLLEILLQENEYSAFTETVTIAEKIQTEFVKMGNLNSAGTILSHLREVDRLLPDTSVQWKERIRNALIIAGGWEKLSYLAGTLNNNSSISSEEIVVYLSHFGWEAISAIIDLLGELEHRRHRMAIVDHLVRTGKEHVDIISKGISDRRWFVVRNTALILGEIGNDRAVAYLEKAIKHKDTRVRQEVIRGLTKAQEIINTDLLIRLLWDADILGRQVVLKAILSSANEGRLNAIVTVINDDRFSALSESEQEQMVMAFSRFGGEYAVDYLNSLISDLKSASPEIKNFYRKLAFTALSCNPSEKAKKALLEFSRSRKAIISNMAEEALKHRDEILSNGV